MSARARATVASSVALALACASLFFAGPAGALRATVAYRLEPVVPLPEVMPRDGALVVTARATARARAGNVDPRRVTVTDPRGQAVRVRVEELAPALFRIAPPRRFASGVHAVSGIAELGTLRVGRAATSSLSAPAVVSITNERRPLVEGEAGLMLERVVVSLREVPSDARVLVARWVDWHDAEGGLYGAWRVLPAGASTLPLICTAELDCGRVGQGHIPRESERGELRYLDAAGRLSPPTTVVVTTAP